MESTIKILEQDHLYTRDQKLKWWGYGEWVEELDAFRYEYKGYECLVLRICRKESYTKEEHYFGGHLCGYVVIPKNHPFYALDFTEIKIEIDCHGGITFSECNDTHLIGFDCAHSGDYVPSTEKLRGRSNISKLFFNPTYKNFYFCMNECFSIVDQLSANDPNLIKRMFND